MAYINVGKVEDFEEGLIYRIDLGGEDVAFVRLGNNRLHAFGNACPHWGVSLADTGFVKGSMQVICMMHDSTFDLRSGRLLDGPASDDLPIYKVKLEGDDVLVGWD